MNQILSVEMPKRNNKRVGREPKKASTKSVVIFFSIVLLIFGVALIGMGVFAGTKSKEQASNKPAVADNNSNSIRIDVIQNATELEIEVTGESEISKVEYNWTDGETKQIDGNGTKLLETSIKIPNGTKTLNLVATDINGEKNNYSKEFVGPNELEHVQLEEADGNKIKVKFNQEQKISYIAYYYDNEEETKQEVNGSNEAEIEIITKEGEHDLTLKVGFEDGTVSQKTSKLYVPTVKVSTDGNNFIVKVTDKRNLTKAIINLNGVETQEDLSGQSFEKVLPLQDGENRLILTVYNTEGGKVMKKIKWEKK